MEKAFDIVTIGVIAYDMILRVVDETVFTRDTTVLQEVGVSSGGGAMTQAVVAQRLGCKTALVGKVCADVFSDYLIKVLQETGVDYSNVKVSPNDTMSLTFALVKPNGMRHLLGVQGSNNRTLCMDDFDISIVRKAKIVSYGSFYFLQGLDKGGVTTILGEAKNAGAITAADAANDLFSQGRDILLNTLPLLDYFIPSQVEAEYLTGETSPAEMAHFLLRKGCRNVIIKIGADGSYVANDKIAQVVPPFDRVNVCDTTGAGDNFVGGFLAGLIDGNDILEASRYANAVAAISVTGLGATTAVRNKQQVLNLMNH